MSRWSETDLNTVQVRMHKRKIEYRTVPAPVSKPFTPFTLALVGQMPSGKNQVRTGWTVDKQRPGKFKPHKYPDKTYTNWRSQAHFQILEQRPALPPAIEQPVTLMIQYFPGDKRKRDVDGMLSALFHLLVYAKVLKDDGLIYNVEWNRYPQVEFPKVVMDIIPWQH